MRSFFLLLVILLTGQSASLAQNTETTKQIQLPPAPPLLSPALCGKWPFLLSLSGKSVGVERGEIKCLESGYKASVQTNMKLPGAVVDFYSEIELDKAAIPTRFTSKGTIATTQVDQTMVFKDGKATVTTKEGTQEILYQSNASLIMSNSSYLLALVAARYDVARGGAQTIPLFPNLSTTIERTARDEVQPIGAVVAPRPTAFDRYTMTLGASTIILWADMQGRVVLISLPLQNFVAVHEDYAGFVQPLHAALASVIKALKPDYSAPPDAPFTAEEVAIKVKGYVLAGTLLLPKIGTPPFPVVLTSTGSGQQTRDEPLPYANLKEFKPFRQIAENLASRGIAVLRVDDRGVGDSTGIETLEQATTFDFADDVRAQVAYLRTRREIDPARIAIVGHSEGGVIAPMVAASDPKIAAIVLMAGTGKRGDEVLLYQMNRPLELNPVISDEQKTKERAANQQILRTVIEGGDTSKLPPLFRFKWTKTFLTYDPLPTIRKVKQPILILQGGLDRQVTPDQADILAKAALEAGNKDVTVRMFPTLNHLFLPATTGDADEYDSLETHVLGNDFLSALSDWLLFKLQRSDPRPIR